MSSHCSKGSSSLKRRASSPPRSTNKRPTSKQEPVSKKQKVNEVSSGHTSINESGTPIVEIELSDLSDGEDTTTTTAPQKYKTLSKKAPPLDSDDSSSEDDATDRHRGKYKTNNYRHHHHQDDSDDISIEEGEDGVISDDEGYKRPPVVPRDPNVVQVWTDGACPFNGAKNAVGGIGVFWGKDDPKNVAEPLPLPLKSRKTVDGQVEHYRDPATNQKAEIYAVIRALGQCLQDKDLRSKKEIIVWTDSSYVVSCVNQWIAGWKKRGWITTTNTPVKNQSMLRLLDEQIISLGNVSVRHMKGHKGYYGNEQADALAREGAVLAKKKMEQEKSHQQQQQHQQPPPSQRPIQSPPAAPVMQKHSVPMKPPPTHPSSTAHPPGSLSSAQHHPTIPASKPSSYPQPQSVAQPLEGPRTCGTTKINFFSPHPPPSSSSSSSSSSVPRQ